MDKLSKEEKEIISFSEKDAEPTFVLLVLLMNLLG